MAEIVGYQVWDRTRQDYIGTYRAKSLTEEGLQRARRLAHRRADNRDMEHGAVCCSVLHMLAAEPA